MAELIQRNRVNAPSSIIAGSHCPNYEQMHQLLASHEYFATCPCPGLVVRCCLMPRLKALLLVWSVVAAVAAHAAEIDLSENQAIALFYARNLDLIAARYSLEQSKAQQIVARAVPNPVFGVGVAQLDTTHNAGNSGAGPAAGFSVSQLIETAGKRRLRMESSALGTSAAENDLADAMRTLSAAVRHAFYALLLSQQDTAVAQEAVDRYARIVALNEIRLTHGDIAQSDLWRLKVEALKARSELLSAQTAGVKAHVDLATLLRWPDDVMDFRVEGEWPRARAFADEPADTLLARALEQRPDLQSARKQAAKAEKDLHLARRSAIPDVTISGGYAHDPNNINTETANLGVSVQVPLFYRNEGEVRKAEIAVDSAQLQIQQLAQAVRADITNRVAVWRSASAIVDAFERDALQQVKDIRDGAELSYQKGQTGILDLIDAQRDFREVMREFHNVLYNRTSAYIDLQAALASEVNP